MVEERRKSGLAERALVAALAFGGGSRETLQRWAEHARPSRFLRRMLSMAALRHLGATDLLDSYFKASVRELGQDDVHALTQEGWGPPDLGPLIVAAPLTADCDGLLARTVASGGYCHGMDLVAAQRLRACRSNEAQELFIRIAQDPDAERDLRRLCLTASYDWGRRAHHMTLGEDDPLHSEQVWLRSISDADESGRWATQHEQLNVMRTHFRAALQVFLLTGSDVTFKTTSGQPENIADQEVRHESLHTWRI
jgi:hypothetical protein